MKITTLAIIFTMIVYAVCGYIAIAEWVDNKDLKARKWGIVAAVSIIVLIVLIFVSCSIQRTTVQQHGYWNPTHKVSTR